MFKKILQSLSRSQSAKTETPKYLNPLANASSKSSGSVLDKIAKPATTQAPRTPEEMCDLTPKMPKDEIQARLKLLYRRYNRSASSLDMKIRAEADQMLNAIVLVREKYFGEI
jgi:hypothetical protein